MKIVGLTGSIGMGKSTVSTMCHNLGIRVWDADATVHDLYAHDRTMRAYIALHHIHCLTPDGVNRKMLGQIILNDDRAMSGLLNALNPILDKNLKEFLKQNSTQPLVILDHPLLFESRQNKKCDVVLVVSAGEELQRERVMARPGMTEELFENLLARQMPDREKCALADFVIDTGRTIADTHEQVRDILWKII